MYVYLFIRASKPTRVHIHVYEYVALSRALVLRDPPQLGAGLRVQGEQLGESADPEGLRSLASQIASRGS